jgi:hypothetical protein
MQQQQHQRPQQQRSRTTTATAKQTMMTKPSASPPPAATPLRIKTPIDAWGEDLDDHTRRSTYTATTQETAASSTVFSDDDGSSSACQGARAIPSTSSPRANLLMKMLAKEMAATLLRDGSLGGDGLDGDILGLVHLHHNQGRQRRSSAQDDDSDDDDDDCSEGGIGAASASASVTASSSYLGSLASEDIDVESVVQMVVASVQKQQKQKQHQQEQKQPASSPTRSAKPQPSSSTRHPPQKSPRKVRQQEAPFSNKKALTPDALLSPSSHHTIQTKTSELSLGSGSKKAAQMDIWHPDFWALQEGGAPTEGRQSSSTTTPAAPTAAVVIEDLRPVDKPEDDDDDDIVDDVADDDDDDDVSVLSDISGLTDAWNLDGLRKKGHGSRGAAASPKKVGGLASLLFGGNSSSHSRKTKSSYDGATKSSLSHTTDASSIIGSHVAGTLSSAGDNRSVSTRRSKSSMSSGGTSKGTSKSKAKNKFHGQASQQPCTPSTKSVSSSASSSKRSRAAGSTRSSNMPPAKTVSFSTVHVREYERILCDNPATSAGLSVGIGWQFVDVVTTNHDDEDDNDANVSSAATMTVDDWELRQKRGRSQSELLLSRREREIIVRQWGCTDREITAMKRELNKCRAQRRQTVNNLGAQKVEEAVESVRSKVKSLLFLQARDDRGGGVGAGNTATLVSI